MFRIANIAALVFLVMVLVACTPPDQVEVARPSIATVGTPETGKATVVGQIISTRTGQPLADTIVRLPEVYGEGDELAFALDGATSPGAITGKQGEFEIANIEARGYVLMVGDIYGANVVVPEPDNSDKARVWYPADGEILDLGQIRVDL